MKKPSVLFVSFVYIPSPLTVISSSGLTIVCIETGSSLTSVVILFINHNNSNNKYNIIFIAVVNHNTFTFITCLFSLYQYSGQVQAVVL